MKREVIGSGYVQSYDSIEEFYNYLCKTPFNEAFRWAEHSSVKTGFDAMRFTKTQSFDEATALLKNGWEDMAARLQKQLQSQEIKLQPAKQQRSVLSVQGFQPVVPLYLAGVPQNMVSKQMVPVKQKVVDIVKLFNYSAGVGSDKIEEESIKVMQLVKKLERQGVKCNVFVALGTSAGGRELICSIKVKAAGERLNVSKLAFPLVHPSMLRRLLFRYIEVCPDTTKSFVYGYGAPVGHRRMKELFPKKVVLPAIWDVDINSVSKLEDITGTF